MQREFPVSQVFLFLCLQTCHRFLSRQLRIREIIYKADMLFVQTKGAVNEAVSYIVFAKHCEDIVSTTF